MQRYMRALAFTSIMAAIFVSGCGGTGPDLVPLPYPAPVESPSLAYCNLHQDHGGPLQLIVMVKNRGAGVATASTTTVSFGGTVVAGSTPSLAPGQSTPVAFTIPDVSTTDKYFTITIDAYNEVRESDEANNTVKGYCIG